ncbi:MAG: hypothetical protein MUC48_17240 [Leptolyngbya sp. Prado105]|jgi:hypothetical protein|nr:hypothetical protein [Leptolyngbya sp. Prado105]
MPWVRWWTLEGELLLTGSERAELAEQRLESTEQRLESAEQRAIRLAEKLRELGIDPDELA